MSTDNRRLIRPNGYTFSLAKRRTWHADEPNATDDKATPAPDDKAGAVDSSDKPKVFDEAYVKELRAENADWRKKTRDLEKRMADFEDSQNKAKEAKLKEEQKWQELAETRQKELEKIQSDLQTERMNNLRTRVGMELNLPPALVARLQGATEDEIRADATTLAKELGFDKPKTEAPPANAPAPDATAATPQQPARSQTTTTAVPGGQPVTRTDTDRHKEYYGGARSSPIFNPANGGKVIFHGNPKDLE